MTRVSFAVLVAFFGGRTLIHTTNFQEDAERIATFKVAARFASFLFCCQ